MKGYAIKGQPFKISINRLWVISNCLIMAAFFSLNSFFSQSSYKKVLEQQFKVKQYQMLVYISDTLEQSMQSIELLSRSTVNNYSIINNILNYKKNKNSYEQMVFQNNMNQNLSSVAYSLGDIISVNILLDDEGLKTTKINGVYDYGHYVTGSGLDGIPGPVRGMGSHQEERFAGPAVYSVYHVLCAAHLFRYVLWGCNRTSGD